MKLRSSKVNATGAAGTVQQRVKRAVRQLASLWDGLGKRNLTEAWLGGSRGGRCGVPYPFSSLNDEQNAFFHCFSIFYLAGVESRICDNVWFHWPESIVDNSEAPKDF